MAEWMITSSMTSRDLERSRSWPQHLWCTLFRKRLEIETRLQWGTYRKWHVQYRMVTWPMTSRYPQASKSWPSYIDANISKTVWVRGLVPITTNRKWPMLDRMITSSMTSRDLERSRSWPQYLYGPLFWKRLNMETQLQWAPIGNGIRSIEWWRDRWRHVTHIGQNCDLDIFRCKYLENGLS